MNRSDTNSSNAEHVWATEAMCEFLNASLPKADIARFEAHLATCETCRQDIEFDRALLRGMRERRSTDYVPHHSLNKLNARIDEFEEKRGGGRVRMDAGKIARPTSRVTRWLLLAQAAVIAVLAIALVREPTAPQITEGYQTLSTDTGVATTGRRIQVVFSDDLTNAELRALLLAMDATIARGPTEAGLYEIRVAADGAVTPDNALDALRSHDKVVFATLVGQ